MRKIFCLLAVLCALYAPAQVMPTVRAFSNVVATVSGGYVAEQTIQMNFANQYLIRNQISGWDTFPAASDNTVPAGTTYTAVRDNTNTATGVGLTVVSGFSGSSGSAPVNSTPNTSIFCADQIAQHFWSYNTTTASIKITGLTVGKYYQIYILANGENYIGGAEKFGVGATETAAFVIGSNYGSCGPGNDLGDAALRSLRDITPQPDGSITIVCTKTAGSEANINALVIQRTATPTLP